MAGVKLVYLDTRARGEAIRMMYALAGKELEDERVSFEQWQGGLKAKQPLGQLPVFTCEDGELLMSNTIARYAAKKLGLMGDGVWEEAINDMIQETCLEVFNDVTDKIYMWKVFKMAPVPEEPEKVMAEIKEKCIKALKYIQCVAEKRGKKFISSDKICLGDLWLYATLEFVQLAYPDIMEATPWIKEFVEKIASNERLKKYLAGRPPSEFGV